MLASPHILKFALLAAVIAGPAIAAPPRVTDERYKLEPVAAEPEIVTPVGMAFDSTGRLLVIESHTHQRPEEYEGPASDRIRMFSDSDGDGKLDKWSTFADGFRHAMNVLVRKDGGVYLVERGRVLLLKDTDADGKADKQDVLVRLETEDDYPHNALGGIAQLPNGELILGLGENHGLPFQLIGSDGKVISGTGGLDGVFRCTADGKNLQHIARGVWNPFSLCALEDGRIFAVDNDPDSSPPCRLLHIVDGGDYGYLYQYGRAGTHPLQAWDGELPGTLPMVCGTGEAPTAIVPHASSLWVTSWGDYRIERYRLVPRGASYGAEREVVVQGDADFRPTGMAVSPDGSIYFGDWVLRDYPVHGKGRVWRLTLAEGGVSAPVPPKSPNEARIARLTKEEAIASDDPFVRAAGVWRIAEQKTLEQDGERLMVSSSSALLSGLAAMRLVGSNRTEAILRDALADDSPDVRLYAVRWIGDERIVSLRDDVAKLLEGPQPSVRYYLAVLAAVDWLDNEPSMRGAQIADELLVRELKNKKRSPETHALALKLLSPDNKFLSIERLDRYLKSECGPLRLEAVRTLAQQSNPERFGPLASIAADEKQDAAVRVEAIVGLAADVERQQVLLEDIAKSFEPVTCAEARRVLRLAGIKPEAQETKPAADNLTAWNKLLETPGDAESGRRLFFSSIGPRCGVCHQHDGRGGQVGPDLTNLGRSNNREQIIASILQPSREVAPHFQAWSLVTKDGKTLLGLRQPKAGDSGTEYYVDSEGKPFSLLSEEIAERSAATTSLMPDGLQANLSIDDLRDLVMFLSDSN